MARRQHGLVARRQLIDAGVGPRAIDERIGRGRLHVVHRGVYAVGHTALSVRGRWMAAVLAGGTGAVLSHRTAAMLWGLIPRSSGSLEVTRPTNARRRPRIVLHRSPLPEDEWTRVDGIPVTSVSRTIFDLAAVGPRSQVERALNEVEVLGLTDSLSIPDLLERYPRRGGSAVLRGLLGGDEGTVGIARSELEERFAAFLDVNGIPRPRFNADLAVAGRFFSVDCLWSDQRLIVELDGRAVHGTARAFEADRERDRLLLVDGWRVMRITWRQLRDQQAFIATDLRSVLIGHQAHVHPAMRGKREPRR
jgi:very-short-patch-repair endonuclease/predicted transcriptional regulator of viral defense system